MASTLQQIAGCNAALARLQDRVVVWQNWCLETSHGLSPKGGPNIPITTSEVELIEIAVTTLHKRITGDSVIPEHLWQSSGPYERRFEQKQNEYWRQQVEGCRVKLLWINQTQAFVQYLEGCSGVPNQPSPHSILMQDNDANGIGIEYDVAISFAGPDRPIAATLAEEIRSRGFRVFYDEYEAASLWGVDLYAHLSNIYANRSRYCLILISKHYAERLWTKHELRAAQARAFKEHSAYILPLRLGE